MYLRYVDFTIVFPYSLDNLRKEYPQVSFPTEFSTELLEEFGVYSVVPVIPPIVDPATQIVEEGTPTLITGQWTQTWVVRDLTVEELTARIPKSVTALQGMLAIQAAGLAPAFLTWKATLDPIADFETLAFLDKAQTWEYDSPILNAALVRMSLVEQKAALFTLAGTL